jgi:hypothetical protein
MSQGLDRTPSADTSSLHLIALRSGFLYNSQLGFRFSLLQSAECPYCKYILEAFSSVSL